MSLFEAFLLLVVVAVVVSLLVAGLILAKRRKQDRLKEKMLARQDWLDFWLDPKTSFQALMSVLRSVKDRGDHEILFDVFGVVSVRRLLELFRPDQMWQVIEIMVNGVNSETVSMISGGAYADPDKFILDIAQQLVEVLGGHDEAIEKLDRVSWVRHEEGVRTTLRNTVHALQELHDCEVSGEEKLDMLARGYTAMGAVVPDLLTTKRVDGAMFEEMFRPQTSSPASPEDKDPNKS